MQDVTKILGPISFQELLFYFPPQAGKLMNHAYAMPPHPYPETQKRLHLAGCILGGAAPYASSQGGSRSDTESVAKVPCLARTWLKSVSALRRLLSSLEMLCKVSLHLGQYMYFPPAPTSARPLAHPNTSSPRWLAPRWQICSRAIFGRGG